MDTGSKILLRLADPQARGGVLTPDALLAIATVGYGLDAAVVTEPATAVFERFDVAVPVAARATGQARFSRTGDPVPWELTASWDAAASPAPGADAVWAGAIVARTALVDDTVEAVDTALPDLDAEFAAARAGLPAGATADQVRTALRTAAATALDTPPLTDTELDALLRSTGIGADGDPAGLGRQVGGRNVVATELRMAPAGSDPAPAPIALPVVVAFLVGEETADPRQLLLATAAARQAAARYPVPAAPPGAPARLVERVICWVLPDVAFDDDGWPGGAGQAAGQQRDARLGSARLWLAGQGVAVVTAGGDP
jgi:hypothetical protein